ncbi:YraN family protein [Thermomonospora amylolytica]|uniref:YraN family protein n=1 Tax=Thermomonospora amylolytica TaxID=1411117 RepID=UPI000E6D3904|nr:YraN family protein [Thermomonospora amylolytica]
MGAETKTNRKQSLGRRGEESAARYLADRLGWTIVERNWRCPEGELDIVAYDGTRHVVCEVKTRSGTVFGAPVEAVTRAKAARLRRLAGRWAAQHGVPAATVRVDVIGLVLAPRGDRSGFELDHLRGVC